MLIGNFQEFCYVALRPQEAAVSVLMARFRGALFIFLFVEIFELLLKFAIVVSFV